MLPSFNVCEPQAIFSVKFRCRGCLSSRRYFLCYITDVKNVEFATLSLTLGVQSSEDPFIPFTHR